jgi:hypothetical protein
MDVSPPQIDQLVTPLEELARVGAALSYEKDINRLLEIIIDVAKQLPAPMAALSTAANPTKH